MEFGFARATFMVAYRDDKQVVFIGDIGKSEGYYANVIVAFDDNRGWHWAGMGGGCVLAGAPGVGWDGALGPRPGVR